MPRPPPRLSCASRYGPTSGWCRCYCRRQRAAGRGKTGSLIPPEPGQRQAAKREQDLRRPGQQRMPQPATAGRQPTADLSASPSARASSGVSSTTSRPAALERHAHDDAAALLGDLKRTVTRPRLHRRHPAPLPCPGAAPNRNRRIGPADGAWRYSSQPHTSRSVPLLSRVRPPDGNDQRSRPLQPDNGRDQGTPEPARGVPAGHCDAAVEAASRLRCRPPGPVARGTALRHAQSQSGSVAQRR